MMRKSTKLFLALAFPLAVIANPYVSLSLKATLANGHGIKSLAQNTTPSDSTKKQNKEVKKGGKMMNSNQPKVTNEASIDTTHTKPLRDPQNQLQFLEPDMKSKKYNFYERRNISTPLMPRYDLDSAVYQRGKKKQKQQAAYKNNQYFFPAKPKDAWEIGINFGNAMVSGNVKPKVLPFNPFENIGVGFTIRKALGYTFSMRAQYMFQQSTGRNWQPDENLKFNIVLNPFPNSSGDSIGPNYYSNPKLDASRTAKGRDMNKIFFFNYRTWVHDVSLQFIANLGNIHFHKERNLINIYVLGGVDGYFYLTKYDALDKNGDVYDFSPAMDIYLNQNNNPGGVNYLTKDKRKNILRVLNTILDGTYETYAEQDQNLIGYKHWAFVPSFSVGAGIAFHVSKWMTIGLEERVILSQRSNLLDGYRWQQDEHAALSSHNDNISYTSISFNFHVLGKKRTEPLYWLNPIHYSYKKIGDVNPQALAEELFKDDDNDGVPNILDKEPNTKKGCPVDAHGVALDSDHDGIIDCDDKEPFSPPGYPVDANGVAIIPPNPCCDTSGRYSNIPGVPGGITGGDSTGTKPKKNGRTTGNDCSKIELPSVVFDEEKYFIDPQYYGNLHQIAERMLMCPDVKLVVTGNSAARNDQKFNEQLGWNRANAAVDYLVEKYGISRDRFIIKYSGGKKAATGTPYEKRMKNRTEFRYANEGENGDSNPPAPHPGLKGGSNK